MNSAFRGNTTKNKWHLDKLFILLILKKFLNTTRISDVNVKYVDLLNISLKEHILIMTLALRARFSVYISVAF